MILPVDGVVEARLRSAIARGEAAVLTNDAGVRHLYDDDVVTRPLFCFGRAPIASYFTIGANPSADDFRAGRGVQVTLRRSASRTLIVWHRTTFFRTGRRRWSR